MTSTMECGIYQGFVNNVLRVVKITKRPNEPRCSICLQDYGQPGPGPTTNLDFFNELPEIVLRSYVQHVVEPVITPCGHTFCTRCICTWIMQKTAPHCPMCRTRIYVPEYWKEDSKIIHHPALRTISASWFRPLSPTVEIFNITNLSTRDLLIEEKSMPFIWNPTAMLGDLPKLMVSIARRFHLCGNGATPGPTDMPALSRRSPLSQLHSSLSLFEELKYFDCGDIAPLVYHPDIWQLVCKLSLLIYKFEAELADQGHKCPDWSDPVDVIYRTIKRDLPDTTGGIGHAKWWAYVHCVVKALLVWQAYCERVNQICRDRNHRLHRIRELISDSDSDSE